MATLFVVGTPIGNLEDITLRALRILGAVDLVLCEDTRVTKRLLDRHGIQTRTLSYHSHSKLSRTGEIIELLKQGKSVALVSDAGTPGISDPGSELVKRVREECAPEMARGELKIESVPGPSALVAALSVAGVPGGDFLFLGFLPHKKGRETLFEEMARSKRPVVFYESSHRVMKSLDSLAKRAGDSKKIVVCRELTKVFEEVVDGTAEEVKRYFESHKEKIKGEFVLVIT